MWKLIYDRKCGAVVMLSDLIEDGTVRGNYSQYIAIGLSIVGTTKFCPCPKLHTIPRPIGAQQYVHASGKE